MHTHINTHIPCFVTTATLDTPQCIWYSVENTYWVSFKLRWQSRKKITGPKYQTLICVLHEPSSLSIYPQLHEVIHFLLIGQNLTCMNSICTTETLKMYFDTGYCRIHLFLTLNFQFDSLTNKLCRKQIVNLTKEVGWVTWSTTADKGSHTGNH